jgi:hypothetical protein
MANLNAPNGFNPVRHRNGGTVRYDGGYTIASAEASSIFLGDAVILTGTGNIIDVAPVAVTVLGVFAGCRYTAANGDVVWAKQWVGGTATLGAVAAEAFVYTDPSIVYSVQALTIAAVDIGLAADLNVDDAGNASTGISGMQLESTYGATGQFLTLGLASAPDGIFPAEYAADARVEVIINESPFDSIKPTT